MNAQSAHDPRERDLRTAQAIDPQSGISDDPRVESKPDVNDNLSPDDGIMENDLTEEREITPAQREDVAETRKMDP
jgi:hypothetical protein